MYIFKRMEGTIFILFINISNNIDKSMNLCKGRFSLSELYRLI